ncbi:2-C-methyl-D-erythritol 4-phosphate cytidylyltransferase [Methanobrevibacter filiformis]|uniref:2-C-methyl-D-erythritol 4-phosphate cytidylyltransferase n=2 Tax=Methanobrevibacter filiformis TaxID=55758 RepID=A0A162FL48_9EURY|nr:2-C-methyl-D-erythritol 4-phosphate cytidylyltransferase [Methanobrevibacter filiformis]
MAGGRGKRLKSKTEKPLFKFRDKPLVSYVLNNLKNSKNVNKILIAISPNTPKTKDYLIENYNASDFLKDSNHEFSYIDTPGDGYVEDLSFILDKLENNGLNEVILTINSDLPFISSDTIDKVLEEYYSCDEIAMSVFAPLTIFNDYSIEPSFVFDDLIPSGLNILISKNIIQSEKKLIVPNLELAFNINTLEDVEIANNLLNQ